MSRRVRIAIAATLGVLLLGASPPPHENRSHRQQPQARIADSLQDIAQTLRSANDPGTRDQPCGREQEDRRSPLCAAWHSVDQARRAGDWYRRSFFLGVLTFGAAGAAAWFAKRAADHNRRAADATEAAVAVARQANSDTRRSAARDARPWIVVDPGFDIDISFDVANASSLILIGTKNVGRSPAFNVVITAKLMFSATGRYPDSGPVDAWTEQAVATLAGRTDGFTLLPGEEETTDIIGHALRSDWSELQGASPTACIGVFTCVMYRHGEEQETAVHSGEYWVGLPKGPIQIDVSPGMRVPAAQIAMVRSRSGRST